MSYSIIFETKFIKLTDGRYLHLNRSGCNNDDEGRDKNIFVGEIFTEQQLQDKINSYMANGKSDNWELKIGSKSSTLYDYGKHLERMAKRAVAFNDFTNNRTFYAKRYDGVVLCDKEHTKLTPTEFDKYYYDHYGEGFSYRILTTTLNNEDDIIHDMESKNPIEFYVGKQYAISVA